MTKYGYWSFWVTEYPYNIHTSWKYSFFRNFVTPYTRTSHADETVDAEDPDARDTADAAAHAAARGKRPPYIRPPARPSVRD